MSPSNGASGWNIFHRPSSRTRCAPQPWQDAVSMPVNAKAPPQAGQRNSSRSAGSSSALSGVAPRGSARRASCSARCARLSSHAVPSAKASPSPVMNMIHASRADKASGPLPKARLSVANTAQPVARSKASSTAASSGCCTRSTVCTQTVPLGCTTAGNRGALRGRTSIKPAVKFACPTSNHSCARSCNTKARNAPKPCWKRTRSSMRSRTVWLRGSASRQRAPSECCASSVRPCAHATTCPAVSALVVRCTKASRSTALQVALPSSRAACVSSSVLDGPHSTLACPSCPNSCRLTSNAAPSASEPPAHDGCTSTLRKGPSRTKRAFARLLAHRLPDNTKRSSLVCACTCRAVRNNTSSCKRCTEAAKSLCFCSIGSYGCRGAPKRAWNTGLVRVSSAPRSQQSMSKRNEPSSRSSHSPRSSASYCVGCP